MFSPRNETMDRADLTTEDLIHKTCQISAVTSGPTEPKTFQEVCHYPVENTEIIGELQLGTKLEV